MATYVPIAPYPIQVMDSNGDPLASGTLTFFLSGTATPTNLFSDNIGTSIGTSLTLDSSGYPSSGGNVITLFRDLATDVKIVCKNSGGTTIWTADTLNTLLDRLGSTANGDGASLISIEDTAANFTATNVEAALAEIISDLASTAVNLGASTVGVEDSAANFTGTDVEAVLAECAPGSRAASTTQTGVVELLTTAETKTGTDTTRALTADALHNVLLSFTWTGTTRLTGSAGTSSWTVTNPSTGKYTISHSLTLSDVDALQMVPGHCRTANGDTGITIVNRAASSFEVWVFIAGTLTDIEGAGAATVFGYLTE